MIAKLNLSTSVHIIDDLIYIFVCVFSQPVFTIAENRGRFCCDGEEYLRRLTSSMCAHCVMKAKQVGYGLEVGTYLYHRLYCYVLLF